VVAHYNITHDIKHPGFEKKRKPLAMVLLCLFWGDTQDTTKCWFLDDLIFVVVLLKKVSNSELYCESFLAAQMQKAIGQN
jgi:hypothetical protein